MPPTRVASLLGRPAVVDGALAGFFFAFGWLSMHVSVAELEDVDKPNAALSLVLLAGVTIPLAWRRGFPLSVLAVVSVTFTVFRVLDVPEGTISGVAYFVALYGAGAYGSGRARFWMRAASVSALLVLLVYTVIYEDLGDVSGNVLLLQVFFVVWNLFFFGAAWALGDATRHRRNAEREVQQRAAQLVVEKEENARRAVLDERVRIARELHDVVAHHVSVMGVQAGAARRVLHREPGKAEEALASIEASSRQTVDEMHRLLGFLRQEGEEDSRAPQPGLAQLDVLLDQMRDAGLPVVLAVEGEACALAPGMDLSAYRVLQEALTNTLRHAGRATAHVTVRYSDAAFEVEVLDDGRTSPPDGGNGGGHGLLGMRERVNLHGGELRTGRRRGGGYAVVARFPVKSGP